MAAGVLYTYPDNFRAFKALIAAQYSGVDLKLAPNFVFGETNKSEAFLKKFPTGKVPAFESTDGKSYLTESNAIAYYVANQQLRGTDVASQAQVLQWLNWADSEVLPASCAWVFPLIGIVQYNKNNVDRAKEDLLSALEVLNKHLLTHTYLVGERITLADIVVFTTLLQAFQHVVEPSKRAELVNVTRWFNTLLNQKQISSVIGDYTLCEVAAVLDPKKFADFSKQQSQPQQGQGKKDKKEKKPAAEKPKQQEKKKEVPEPEELDAADEALAAEPKSKDPFDAMPKGTFNMDDFKRVYSNEEEAKSIPYFLEKFDPENYSIWLGEYKYNDELAKVFMSCNLITGMFQRLDKMRKQAFASVILFGEDNNSSISGIWVWRGQELAFPLSPDWQIDYESYDWKKLEPTSPDTKKLVEQYFGWTGADKDGKKFNQGKIFK